MDNISCFANFEADRERYQLRRGTRAIKLERIPLELLFLLIEQNGRLVPREQIVARLWGDDVLLDTERSINTAIRKIRKALGDDTRRPRFIETVVGMGYRFVAPIILENRIRNLHPEIQRGAPLAADRTNREGSEIRLQGFLVEATDGAPVLTCDVVVSNIVLGRLPLVEVELPPDVTLPLKPEDRLLLKLHEVRAGLTAKANQVLHAFCISVLQSGLRTRETDSFGLGKESRAEPPLADRKLRQLYPPRQSHSTGTQQRP